MKCGDLGFKTVNGTPCQQSISASAKGCLWHDPTRSVAERHFYAAKGGMALKQRKLLPPPPTGDDESFTMPEFTSRPEVVRFAHSIARRVLTTHLDPKRADTALRAANVALTSFAQETQERMVEAFLKLERGGTAVVMLERLTESIGSGLRRPLPGTTISLPVPPLEDNGR